MVAKIRLDVALSRFHKHPDEFTPENEYQLNEAVALHCLKMENKEYGLVMF